MSIFSKKNEPVKALAKKTDRDTSAIMAKIVLQGDLSGLSDIEKVDYYNSMCTSLGLNPLTRPFELIVLKNKLVLYAKKDCTDQLRRRHGVSVESMSAVVTEGVHTVTVLVRDSAGRADMASGSVNILGLKGDDLANALMKAETKAKRRATLSLCGAGILDETELETIPAGEMKDVTPKLKEPKKIVKPIVSDNPLVTQLIGLCDKVTDYSMLKRSLISQTVEDIIVKTCKAALKNIETQTEQELQQNIYNVSELLPRIDNYIAKKGA